MGVASVDRVDNPAGRSEVVGRIPVHRLVSSRLEEEGGKDRDRSSILLGRRRWGWSHLTGGGWKDLLFRVGRVKDASRHLHYPVLELLGCRRISMRE